MAAPVGSSANIPWPPPSFGQSCNATATGVALTALCYGGAGEMVGRGAALWGGPRGDLDAAIQRGEQLLDLPYL